MMERNSRSLPELRRQRALRVHVIQQRDQLFVLAEIRLLVSALPISDDARAISKSSDVPSIVLPTAARAQTSHSRALSDGARIFSNSRCP